MLRVAWSLADLAGRERPGLGEIGQALAFRAGCGGFPGAKAMRLRLEGVCGEEQVARAEAVGAVLVARGDADWPTQLDIGGKSYRFKVAPGGTLSRV